ncbi:MAG TPA: PAN domain-containing protein [Stellaceae bacterium]|nr:PAN domain-containing protein [Stellaceae bacterium]
MPTLLRYLATFLSLSGLWLAAAQPALSAELNTNRQGGDYTSFDQQYADPGICESSCMSDGRCLAWTYVRPGLQGPSARCWLKNSVPPASANDCCVSGAKQQQAFRSRWDKVAGPGGAWTTGWVPNMPRPICGHTVGCACGGANYCGEYQSGAEAPYWPNGCGAPSWTVRCTSEPQ